MRAAGRWRGLSGPPVPACDLIKADLISLFSLEILQAPSQGQGLPVCWALLRTHVSGLRSRKMPAWGPDHPSLLRLSLLRQSKSWLQARLPSSCLRPLFTVVTWASILDLPLSPGDWSTRSMPTGFFCFSSVLCHHQIIFLPQNGTTWGTWVAVSLPSFGVQ